ncbi:MAG: hypothetical protein FJ102_04150 [Deltaproteobacteria bacterium]|nr:hypothetical protein [Deltaproteobacteria bacterium]
MLPILLSSSDTTPGARAVQTRLYRAAGGEKRLLMALRMSEDMRRIAEAGIRFHNPAATDAEVRVALARMYLGKELFQRVFGPAAQLARR